MKARRFRSQAFRPHSERDCWAALVVKARSAARKPDAAAQPLLRAAGKAAQCRMPSGYGAKDGPFNQLVVQAKAFWRAAGAERAVLAPELRRLADACDAVLKEPAQPMRRERADIDG